MSARDLILGRIRAGLGRDKRAGASEALAHHLERRARGPLPHVEPDLLTRFRARALLLGSTTDEIRALEELPAAVGRYLEQAGLARAGVCWPAYSDLDWARNGIRLEARTMRGTDLLGVTGVFCAIAETGTLMLLSGAPTPAAVSLLPETHIAVLPASRILAHMEDAWDCVRRERGAVPRAVNFVSGPSRTADIEQTVTLGAHGPYRVHVVVHRD
jgi:L-lactate dehydrogenase complex protein LldG